MPGPIANYYTLVSAQSANAVALKDSTTANVSTFITDENGAPITDENGVITR